MAAGAEDCDDANTDPGDGCSASCQLEAGYTCPVPGQPCLPGALAWAVRAWLCSAVLLCLHNRWGPFVGAAVLSVLWAAQCW